MSNIHGFPGPEPVLVIVEDDSSLNRLICKILMRNGYQVESMATGAEVLTRCRAGGELILLLDYQLPDMTGKAVIEELLQLDSPPPFVVMTGHGDEKLAVEMMKLGARDYIIKDENFLDFLPPLAARLLADFKRDSRLKESDAILRKQEDYYRTILSNLQEDVIVVDQSGIILDLNDAVLKTLNLTREELIGKPSQDLYGLCEADDEGVSCCDILEQVFRLGERRQQICRYRIEGEVVWKHSMYSPLMDGAGNVARVVCSTWDISRIQTITKHQNCIINLMEFLNGCDTDQYVLDGLVERLVLWTEADAVVAFSNAGSHQTSADTPSEVVEFALQELKGAVERCVQRDLNGTEYADLIEDSSPGKADDKPEISNWLAAMMSPIGYQAAVVLPLRFRGRCYGGILLASLSPNFLNSQLQRLLVQVCQYAGGALSEINARNEQLKLEMTLRSKHRLEALGTMAGGVAHEINNPINIIMNAADLILEDAGESRDIRDNAEYILSAAHRMAGIVRNLMAFARPEGDEFVPARLTSLLETTLPLIQSSLRKDGIQLEVVIPDDLPLMYCRPQQLKQVIMNLLTNSRTALNARFPGSDPEKRLILSGSELSIDGRDLVRFTVEDRGIGMSPEIIDRVFDPFFSTRPRHSSMGLGLSVSHGIVSDHHGYLSAESVLGEFTRIHVDIPVARLG